MFLKIHKTFKLRIIQRIHEVCIKRGTTPLTLILRKMTLTPGLLDTVPQQGY